MKYLKQHLRPDYAMDRLFRPHSDRADRKCFLIWHFWLASIAPRNLCQNGGRIAFVCQSSCIDDGNVEPHSNFVDIIPESKMAYLASMLSSANTIKLNCLKKEIGRSLMFIWCASILSPGLSFNTLSLATNAFDMPLCCCLNRNCLLRFDN